MRRNKLNQHYLNASEKENKSRARGYKIINRVFETRIMQSFCRKATFEQRFRLNEGKWYTWKKAKQRITQEIVKH